MDGIFLRQILDVLIIHHRSLAVGARKLQPDCFVDFRLLVVILLILLESEVKVDLKHQTQLRSKKLSLVDTTIYQGCCPAS